jgi:hypothetical protein
MKLRIRGNSLRLRLTRREVAHIGEGLRVEEAIEFGAEPDQRLTYALEASNAVTCITAHFRDNQITVYLPMNLAKEWAVTDTISLRDEQALPQGGTTLKLLVEKDFACLTDRRGTDDEDTFSHPMQGSMRC